MSNKTLRQRFQEAYDQLPDSGLIPDRKSVLAKLNGFEYLIYRKAMIHEIKHGSSSIVADFLVVDTVRTKGKDGLVICLPED